MVIVMVALIVIPVVILWVHNKPKKYKGLRKS